MGKINIFENINNEAVHNVQSKIEENSKLIDEIVNDIVSPYSRDLDNYVDFIKSCLADGENPPTDVELDDFCINLSTYIYFAGGMCEQLGIRDDISKAVYKEVYNSARASSSGTVADKDSSAELLSQQEQLTNICYNRAYKIMKAKVENAQELLSSCKKVLTRRMNEIQLTHLGGK